jgi:hypothetical protein
MPFEPGQSGNPGGRSKNEKLYRDALRKAVLAIADSDPDKRKKIELIAEKHVESCLEGKQDAINALADRLDGKAVQAIANDDDGAPFIIKVVKGGAE